MARNIGLLKLNSLKGNQMFDDSVNTNLNLVDFLHDYNHHCGRVLNVKQHESWKDEI